jgi:hypothetical protein
MPAESGNPFTSVESAYEYICLLGEALNEARTSVEDELTGAGAAEGRRQDALRLIKFKLDQLDTHLTGSRRVLNDLRTLRRMLLGERQSSQSRDELSYSV